MDLLKTDGDGGLQVLWEDGERVFCRGWRLGADGNRRAVLAVLPAAEHPSPASLARLTHEYELKDELDGAWAARPLELARERGRTMLVLEDPVASRSHGCSARPWRWDASCASRSASRRRWARSTARPRPQGHQAGQYPGEPRDRRGEAHRLRHRLPPATRAAGAGAARDSSQARSPTWRPNRPDG